MTRQEEYNELIRKDFENLADDLDSYPHINNLRDQDFAKFARLARERLNALYEEFQNI